MHDAGIFLKNYISFVEELPNDVQKTITKVREMDCKTKNLITEVEKICEVLTSKSSKQASNKMQQILVKINELKDEKIQLSQSLASHIESKYKSVADSYQSNVTTVKQERSPTPKIAPSINPQPNINPAKNLNSSNPTTSSTSSATECQEKPAKRIRKTRIDNLDVDSTDESIIPPVKSAEKPLQTTTNATKRGAAANQAKKTVKKRKQTKKQNAQALQDSIDEVIQDDNITDETTYCICQQISYGEMIFCENDTCPIEWFHFSCVDLTAKPKGRWFCPQCRGDKPNVINKKWRKKQQESSI